MNKIIGVINKIESKNIYLFIFFLLIALIVFGFSFSNLEYFWDDERFVFSNPSFVQAPHWYSFWDNSSDFYKAWPLGYSIFWVLVKQFAFSSVATYKFLNILVHAFNAFLVYHFLKKLNLKYVLLPALLFLIHPLNVESVSWIFQLLNLLALTFLLGSLILFNSFLAKNKFYLILLSVAFFLFSLWTKSIALLAPFLFLALLWINKSKAKYYFILFPYFLLSLFVGMTNIRGASLLAKNQDKGSLTSLSFFRILDESIKVALPNKGSRIVEDDSTDYFNALYKRNPKTAAKEFDGKVILNQGIWHYFTKAFVPVNLTYMYKSEASNYFKIAIALAALIIAPIFFAIKYKERLFYLIPIITLVSLLPYLGLSYITFFYWSNVSDRYTYFFMVAIATICALFLKYNTPIKNYFVIGYLVLLSTLAITHSAKFNNLEKLYAGILEHKNHPVIYSLLFEQYLFKLDVVKARKTLERGLSEFPDDQSMLTDKERLKALEQTL